MNLLEFFNNIQSLDEIYFSLNINECKYYIQNSANLRRLIENNSLDIHNNFILAYHSLYSKSFFNPYKNLPQYTLTEEKEIELFKKYKINKDKEAFNKLVISNIKLVMYLAKEYMNDSNCEFYELVDCGIVGLIKSVNAFDITKGIKFSSYASRGIIQEMKNGNILDKCHIKYDNNSLVKFRSINKFIKNYANKNHCEPSYETIGENLGIDALEVRSIIYIANGINFITSNDLSLIDEPTSSMDDHLINLERKAFIEKFFTSTKFTKMDKELIYKRFYKEMTMTKIAEDYNITVQAVSLRFKNLFKRIRVQGYVNDMNEFYNLKNKIK